MSGSSRSGGRSSGSIRVNVRVERGAGPSGVSPQSQQTAATRPRLGTVGTGPLSDCRPHRPARVWLLRDRAVEGSIRRVATWHAVRVGAHVRVGPQADSSSAAAGAPLTPPPSLTALAPSLHKVDLSVVIAAGPPTGRICAAVYLGGRVESKRWTVASGGEELSTSSTTAAVPRRRAASPAAHS